MDRDRLVKDIVDRIMERRHGASGVAVFVDPVVLRDIIQKALEEEASRSKQVQEPATSTTKASDFDEGPTRLITFDDE